MFKLKKTISKCAELDLRNYSAEALKRIKKISMVATIIIPTDADKEWYEAFSEISLKMCAEVIKMEKGKKTNKINGVAMLNDTNSVDGDYYGVNGVSIIETKEKTPILSCNGICIKRKSAIVNLSKINGVIYEIDDECEYVCYPDNAEIDYNTVNHLPSEITIIAGDDIKLTSDVTEEILMQKKIKFIAGDKIICNDDIFGYVNANSKVGDKIIKTNNEK